MAFTVHVRNFQSLSDVTVEVSGLTVITGSNNTGKSALMRAVRGAFQNTRGTSFISHGQTKSSVSVEFTDGRSVRWEKGTGAADRPTYVIDGKTTIHPGQTIPDEVKNLGVKPITIGGKEVWPQFAPQFVGQLFLIDQPGSVLAEAVSDVEHVSKLNDALRAVESDKRSDSAKIKVRTQDRTSEEVRIQSMASVDSVDLLVSGVEKRAESVNKMAMAISVMNSMVARGDHLTSHISSLEKVDSIPFPNGDDLSSLDSTHKNLEFVSSSLSSFDFLTNQVLQLSPVENLVVPEISAFESLASQVSQLESLLTRFSQLSSQLSGYGSTDLFELPVTDHLASNLSDIESTQLLLSKYQGLVDSVLWEEGVKEANDKLLGSLDLEVESLLDELGYCPTCNRDHQSC